MSTITLEQIDLIMKRANVSYSEAKDALEKCNGDTIEALLYLEKADKISSNKSTTTNIGKVTSFIDKLNQTTFIMEKNNHVFIDIPLSIALIITLLSVHISVIALILSIMSGIRIKIKGDNDLAHKINSTIDDIKKY